MKKIISLLICFLIISLFTTPALAEERSVIGINLPFTTGIISYEIESSNNNSWIFGGFLYLTKNKSTDDINLSLAGGRRFYSGSNKNRYYKGLYATFNYTFNKYTDPYYPDQSPGPSSSVYEGGVAGVFGYEWRFGEARNPRIFLEGGFKGSYSSDEWVGLNFYPVIGLGIGF